MNALYTAIYNLFKANTSHAFFTGLGGSGSATGRFYPKKAPQRATFPYAAHIIITDNNDLDFSDEHEDISWQLDIFSQDRSEAGVLLAAAKTMFDEGVLTVSGWSPLYLTREFVVENNYFESEPYIYCYSLGYEILLEKRRS